MRHFSLSTRLGLLVFGLILLSAGPSVAVPVSGSFDIGGSNATVGLTSISFGCNSGITNAPCPAPAGYGNFSTTAGTGSFAPYTTQGGDIHDVNIATAPINQAFLLSNFIIFSSSAGNPVIPPDIALDLTFVFPGIDPQAACGAAVAVGQTCTPTSAALITAANPLGLSSVNLQNTQTGSTASFSVAGTARRISTGEVSPFNGVFTAQFFVPYQTLLATIAASGTVTNSYSATFQATTVPEPASLSLIGLGLGLMGMGAFARRKK